MLVKPVSRSAMRAVSYHILMATSCSQDQGELYTLEHGLSVRAWSLV